MNKSELIGEFIKNLVDGNTEAARESFTAYCNAKAKSIRENDTKLLERIEFFNQFKKTLLEFGTEEDPIRLVGDDVIVNGKKVGHIENDLNDFEAGINFVSDDKSFSKEFHTAEELFQFITDRFLGDNENGK